MGQRVFAVACTHGGCDAQSAMAGGLALDAACGGGRENVKWDGECVGQARGWLQGASMTPGGARRVASATASRRRVSPHASAEI